ncbi:hypothetical protein [Zhihengliuella salsuginis]|uniref:Restriction endonuclease n=1 Tax=Zhihengliuella salsuginis TaxID=578222 RepID=A0ABQ3GIK8_9MICC|nr:hypothetical protein [Zhihengliuella salsuginis]GHD06243.1 hypothetical protein GCM10008096_16000 [Zhihengliuella salsuginis]
MRGDEKRVVEAFGKYLAEQGWSVEYEIEYCDVRATGPKGQLLFGEAKGRTAALGLDVDTLYGQLLRRMPAEHLDEARFAVIVPEEAVNAALRVPARIRERLGIDVYAVDELGQVELHNGNSRPALK